MAAEEGNLIACQHGQAALAARLLMRVSAGRTSSNLIFSPLSIHVALALMSAGAAEDTLDEILSIAGAPSRGDLEAFVKGVVVERVLADRSVIGGPSVAFACGSWTDKTLPLKPTYRDTVVGTYKGETWAVDFRNHPVESRREINAWVAKATRNLITEVLDPYSPSETLHVVANAIYFKAEWRSVFDKDDTVDEEFHLFDGSTVDDVPFMRRPWRFYQRIACHDGFRVLQLPYKSCEDDSSGYFSYKLRENLPEFSMCVFLPDEHDGLWGLVDKLTSRPEFLREHLPTRHVPVGKFRLPKFKLTYMASIRGVLQDVGLRLPFDRLLANMTEIVGDEESGAMQLCVDEVVHKAVVEMNEEGSEAAAVTVESDEELGFSLCDDYDVPRPEPEPTVDFVADHPFAFFIIEETSGTVVFAGHVIDPTKEE
ncbi:putative serpin-Z8 [Lolium perenne]|uniref:putative serpin-Z8 n=1 Tax=Lolium perenne TaxID=4522 RepID=UPI0021F63DC6|nr:putative serpin-Z8 [Lolium perenne]